MIDLQKNQLAKFILFTSLYFAEGIQLAITTILVPLFLLNENISPAITTIAASTIMVPWALKFIFGWIVDSYRIINKKQYTLIGGLISALALIILGIINPSSNIYTFILILFTAQCGIGILDVSMDAWAITETKKKERGKINGSMMAGFFSGTAFGSAFLTFIADQSTFSISFVSAGIIILSIMTIPIITKKPVQQKKQKKLTKLVLKEFKKKTTLSLAILLPIISINSGIITLAAPLFMNIKLNLTVTHIGLITTVFTIARVIGSLTGGSISDKISRQKTLFFIIISTILSTISLILVNNWITMILIYSIIGFLNGGLFTVLLASSMDITNAKIGAFQFSILISLMNAGELTGEFISGPAITNLGFNGMFLFSAWILGPSLLFLYTIIKKGYFTH
ncbi:MAG: MFS transporter [Candidatus Thermoplasmatota archaeon]|nr:MFS transporter [Candidatus Thermoplasmatota archaeon]